MYKENIFTKIINKEIEANIIYESEFFIVFPDIKPLEKFHFLILPKKSYIDYFNFLNFASIEEKKDLEKTFLKIKKDINLNNIKLITNSGNFQEIFHFHFHLLGY